MECVVCVCALALFSAVQATHVKGLYCQDPDTGKLHALNTTWPSQSFCGNYTCKLRRKNGTEIQYAPITKINISDFKIQNDDMNISPSHNSIVVTTKPGNDKQPLLHKSLLKGEVLLTNNDDKDKDRYLTQSEIKTITDMLHTVKKSDLEAIVDIYNLAQDIYKEIDNVSTKNLVKETLEAGRFQKMEEKTESEKNTYFYDPTPNYYKQDMSHEGTNTMTTKTPRAESNPSYFKGVFSKNDFGKLPYYYPISNQQSVSSYVHPKMVSNDLEKPPTENKPCKKPANNYNYLPWYSGQATRPDLQATAQPTTLLPYPFSYVYHSNVSGYPSSYYPPSSYYNSYYNPWAQTHYNRYRNYPQSYGYYGQFMNPISSHTNVKSETTQNSDSSESKSLTPNDMMEKLIKTPKEKKPLPDWQTEPLSEQVLEEVRAHMNIIDEKKKLLQIPLIKDIRMKKVGKVIKLDDFTRKKRELINDVIEENDIEVNEDELEAYVEATTCENSTEVGYFSYGNMSQPFPDCCPRKINSIHTQRPVINTVN